MDQCILQKSGTSVKRVVVFRKTHQLSCKFRKGFHVRRGNFRLGRERKTINVPTILSLTLVSLTGLLKAERSMVRITDSRTSRNHSKWPSISNRKPILPRELTAQGKYLLFTGQEVRIEKNCTYFYKVGETIKKNWKSSVFVIVCFLFLSMFSFFVFVMF